MSEVLIAAVVAITLALIFYSWGVWAERAHGTLTWQHVGLFAAGLACDATGTAMMTQIAAGHAAGSAAGGFTTIMKWTGGVAITLMALHLVWAVVVILRNHEAQRARFHRLSVVVWGFWLIPYITGAIGANLSR